MNIVDRFDIIGTEIENSIQESIKHLTPIGKLIYLKALLAKTLNEKHQSFTQFMHKEYTRRTCKNLLKELNNEDNIPV